ncbi:peptide chain release factor N(5)-glutamine methyltransferase [Sphingorhabdus sp.]|uniref:peptide chain release factor N(5)-glutamine methyltransferase n=1 Tax=Sphingorhabdus sp. TaxID=1902408 RepID=UPI00391C7CA7
MMTGLASVLRSAAIALHSVSPTPRLDAELLLAHALGIDRSEMLLRQHDLCTPDSFEALLARRLSDEPVAYITGTQAFWNMDLQVTPDVLIPRADSETLLDAAMDWFGPDRSPGRIADLGTGSGALFLAALSIFPTAEGLGIDASRAALAVASNNADRLGFTGRARFEHRDWTKTNWNDGFGKFDLILCNPPYIEETVVLSPMVAAHEPHSALFAGKEGLDDYRILVPILHELLNPGGVAFFEIGYNQAESVGNLAAQAGFLTHLRHDLAGNPRVVRFSLGIEQYND